MKKIFFLLLSALLAGGIKTANAQAQLSIGANGKIFNLRDTVNFNDTNSYFVWIKNTGNANFSNIVRINIGIDSTQSGNGFIYYPLDSILLQIPAGDSVPYTQTVNYLPGGPYRMGGNIVVIWPSAIQATTLDSTRDTTVYILGTASVHELFAYKNILIFPNPSADNVFIYQKDNSLRVDHLRLLDLSGSVLKEWSYTNVISLKEFAEGVYFLQADFADKTSYTYKIIRRE